MEPIQHSTHTRHKRNTARTNVTISVVIHVILFALGAYWAAHEGVLGKKLQELSATILAKEKKLDQKKDEPKEDAKKVEQPKVVETAKTTAAPPAEKFVPPPAATDVGSAPPPVTIGGGFAFTQDDLSDPVVHYKQSVESTLRAKWERPSDVDDLKYVAEIEVALDATGHITGHDWKKGSGDKRWDDSVKKALAATTAMSRPPPKGFPGKFLVRFDVETQKTEPLIQASLQ